MEDLAERVKFAREKRGLTRRRLALVVGLSSGYFSLLERRLRMLQPRAATIERIANALEVSPAWLAFGGKPPAFRKSEAA